MIKPKKSLGQNFLIDTKIIDKIINIIEIRDKFILELCNKKSIPVQVSMGGGYSELLKNIIDAHSNTFRLAQEI